MPDASATSIATNLALIGSAIALANLKKHQEDESAISMAGIDPDTGEEIIPEKEFQWWPETLNDTIQTGWQEKNIPGGSHSIMQWGSNGGRTITFEAKFTRYLKYPDVFSPFSGEVLRATLAFLIDPTNARNKPFNADIQGAIAWLRAFCYPEYDESGGVAKPPVICVLGAKGMALNEDGSDVIFAVMTACDVQYIRLFEDGRPRSVNVALTFKQVVQSQNGVTYKGRSALLDRDWETTE